MMPARAPSRRAWRVLAASVAVAGALACGGCVTQPVPQYQASIANQMALAQMPADVRFRVTTGTDPANIQTQVRSMHIVPPGKGSWSDYLNQAMRTELKTAGHDGADAPATLDASLTRLSVLDGQAELAGRFVIRRDGTVVYDKALQARAQWDTHFIGVLAATDGFDHSSAIFQSLLHALFDDPDFVAATRQLANRAPS
ncbi:hypothetical protein [Burkholderia sp. Cy-637]|uniref:hypothetical protein n=1 Tax=Burkholderia sp. Cy-637 TaxID=2608327 RepID=UPI0014249631|nr:hypothetical protein [Burkholderia sp. Cy-637]NIF88009.1 hypothetical protein [Burkholderia sp. Cy-637]